VTSEASPGKKQKRAVLSRDLSEFLMEFSIGVHRYAMYPPGHPSLAPAVENIVGRLSTLFIDRRGLAIGVAQDQLVIEGIATDSRHPVLSDLASRLHDHQLGAVGFNKGATAVEIQALLTAIAAESQRGGTPLGLLPPEEFPSWTHVRLYRVGYEQLEMRTEDSEDLVEVDRATALWLGLAQAAMMLEDPLQKPPEAQTVAESINRHGRDDAYDRVIVGYMLQLAEELKGSEGRETERMRRRVSELVKELDDETLERLVTFGGNRRQRDRFLLDANQSLAVDSVMRVLQAAASSNKQTISHSMTRLLKKLATHAEQGQGDMRSQADTALRDNVEALIGGWDLDDPNPDGYTTLLDRMSEASPIFRQPADDEKPLSGPHRLVQMALEVEAFGPTIGQALSDLMTMGETSWILDLLTATGPDNQVAARIRGELASPARFRNILGHGRMDDRALRTLVEDMGEAAIEPLLDVLAESESRAVRRQVFDVLLALGPRVGERVVARLGDSRWFVIRNLLALMTRLPELPTNFDVQPFLDHADHRVRREALPVAMRLPNTRIRTVASALGDSDERIVRVALSQLRGQLPEAVVPTLVNRVVVVETRSDEIRALGARLLRYSRSPLALKALLHLTTAGKNILGRSRLAAASPVSIAALQALAAGWSHDATARVVLDAAAKGKDPELRAAAQVGADVVDDAGLEHLLDADEDGAV